MRKKYVRPSIVLVKHFLEVPMLAGSPGDGEWVPPGPGGGSGIGSGEEGPSSSEAKENTFSTWEDWDEY